MMKIASQKQKPSINEIEAMQAPYTNSNSCTHPLPLSGGGGVLTVPNTQPN